MKVRLLFLSLFALVAFAPTFDVEAAANYSVTPRVIDITAESRDLIDRQITVTNNAKSVSSIFISVNEISLSEGGDITEFKGPTEVERQSAITSWLEITRAELNLQPGETREVPLAIRMNPDTKPGEYHALLGFGYGRTRDDAEEKVKEGRAPSIVVTIRVEDDAVEFVDLEGFIIDKYITSNENQAISYTLNNPGDTTVIPVGEIIVYDSNGKEITSIDANPERKSLAPGQEIRLDNTMPIDGMVGRHKAFLNVRYGDMQTAAVYDTTFFYAVPWKFLLAIFILVLLIAIVLTLYLHRRYGLDEDEDDDADIIDFHFSDGTSDEQDHDINLKQK